MRLIQKKWLMFLFLSVLAFGLVACGNQEKNQVEAKNGEKFVIKIADHLPKTHLISIHGTLPWIERIEELGEGKIEVEYYPAEQLGKVGSQLDNLKNKVVDISFIAPQWNASVMPVSAVSGNPGIIKDSLSASKAYNKIVQEDLYEIEFKPNGIKPLWAGTLSPYQIVNSKHPITSLEDLKGLKIRTADGLQEEMMNKWGATPISVPGNELYSAWERGIVDGTVISFSSWPVYQLETIAKYSTVNATLPTVALTYSVNEDIWNSWPKEIQDAVQQASDEIIEQFANGIMGEEEKLIRQYQEETDVEFFEIPEDELQEWNKEMQPFNKKWAEDLDSKGLPGTEILEKFIQYNEEFSKKIDH
ncbi:TRAP transporter substrate-binding protein DctP [Psychrobacillus sp. OK032]|uniref:TRAP transporter substrate-binding protein n=1 Tax=Psychrobacillus sp. OK032 TaxID=1884358 RepID=UPI0008D568AE|nr:TRAP transporter substrate-binding protein DctP [Psychrobacillus sp. OK032]SER82748.1 TRAP-type C4-dicarboxylate transport system, substrate-binding protein [Psychrobacillus sp. OK032]